MDRILIAMAGGMGATAIMLAAAGAHGQAGTGLSAAGFLLLAHAVATIALVVAVRSALVSRRIGLVAAAGFVLGALLFAADITSRSFLGHRLLPFAAPTGGTIMIIAWLALIPAALLRQR